MAWKTYIRAAIPKPLWHRYVAERVAYKHRQMRQNLVKQFGRYAEYTLTQRTLPELFPQHKQRMAHIPIEEIVRDDEMEMPLSELVSLAGVTQLVQPQRIFEFGTYLGASTLVIAQNSPADSQLFTLDLDPATCNQAMRRAGYSFTLTFQPGERFHYTPEATRIHQLYGGLEPFDFTPYYGTMDLVLVDADHSYDFVKADTAVALKLIKPGGVIVWDDYTWKDQYPECVGVTRCLNELADSKPIYRIAQTRFGIYIDHP